MLHICRIKMNTLIFVVWTCLFGLRFLFGLNRTLTWYEFWFNPANSNKSQCKHGTLSSRGLAQSSGLLTLELWFLELLWDAFLLDWKMNSINSYPGFLLTPVTEKSFLKDNSPTVSHQILCRTPIPSYLLYCNLLIDCLSGCLPLHFH